MNSLTTFITKVKTFISTYKWLLFPIVPIIIFVSIIFYLFYAQKNSPKPPANRQNTTEVSQSPSQAEISPATEISPGVGQSYTLEQEIRDIANGNIKLSSEAAGENGLEGGYPTSNGEADAGSTSQQKLSDGSTEYEIPSDDPNRPNLQILNEDGFVIFRRILVSDATVNDYSEFLQNPEYTEQGSSYYGSSAEILAAPSNGIAVVVNPQTGNIYEQYLFHKLSLSDFLKKYGKDISAYQP